MFWLSFFVLLALPVLLLNLFGQGLEWVLINLALWGQGELVRLVVGGIRALLILLFLGHSVWAARIALNSELDAITRFAPSVAVLLLFIGPAVLAHATRR